MPAVKPSPKRPGGRPRSRGPRVSQKDIQESFQASLKGETPPDAAKKVLEALADAPEAFHGLSKTSYQRLVRAHSIVHEEGDQQLIYMAQALILCGLPYRPLRDEKGNPVTHYQRTVRTAQGRLTLTVAGVQPGILLPFGKDRLALSWLQTRALRQDDPCVRWETATEFFDLFGLSKSGREYQAFRATWSRLSNAVFSITYEDTTHSQGKLIPILEEYSLPTMREAKAEKTGRVRLPGLPYFVTLSPTLWAHLKQVPVPQRLEILREFADEPKAWDFVAFVCWRAKACEAASLKGGNPTARIPWGDLVEQLGSVDKNHRQLRASLAAILARLRVIWPECRADFEGGRTLVIQPPFQAIHPVRERLS